MDKVDQDDVAARIAAEDDLGEKMEKLKVSSLVSKYLEAQNLGVLPEGAMQTAVEEFVDKGDKDAISK
jgi:double-strand break repair protein MRE11